MAQFAPGARLPAAQLCAKSIKKKTEIFRLKD
jgi:hypothetical protein